ncbi:MAG: TRAP transporter substrate-binding protein DctP [Deltaproteobacteria bacterium]|nr:TRAP transporter substrate-binding protein DctP [Deltaproteobacteria bacterium]
MSEKMSRRSFVKNSVVAATGAALMVGTSKPAHSQSVITWKGQTAFPSTVAPYGPFRQGETGIFGGAKQWTEWLFKRTNGRLKIDWAEPGAIFPLPESDKSIAQGIVQIAHSFGAYYAGRIPETDIEAGGVFFWEDETQAYECLYKYGLFKALQNVYTKHNIFWLPFHTNAIVGIGTNFPAPNAASIKGRKIRTSGIWGDYVEMLGGTPVAIPWGDVYMGAKLGTIDGWIAGIASLEELKLKEVGKGYVVDPYPNSALLNILINKDAYEKLPKDIKDILLYEAPHWSYFCANNWRNQCIWVMNNAMAKYGVKVYRWSPEEKQQLTKMAVNKIFPKIAGKSSACAQMMDIIKRQMKDYGRI